MKSQMFQRERINSLSGKATFLAFISILIIGPVGCRSKAKAQAQAQARMAYLAGQRDAIAQMNEHQNPDAGSNNLPSNITFIGPVENFVIPWTEGLTLGRAIVSAVYHSQTDPAMISIHRASEEMQIDPARLLNGQDYPLRPGDVVQFHLPRD